MSTETVEKDSKNYPILRNLQYSPLKQGEEQYIVLWDPTGLSLSGQFIWKFHEISSWLLCR